MAYDVNLKAAVAAAAGAINTAISQTNSAAVVLGPIPSVGMVFNVHLGLNSGDMVNRVLTASVYIKEKAAGTMRLAGTVVFTSGAVASTAVKKHGSVVAGRDLLAQVSGTVPGEIAYLVSLTETKTDPCNAVNYKCDVYPAVGQGFSFP